MQNVTASSSIPAEASSSGPVLASPALAADNPGISDASFAGLLAALAAQGRQDNAWKDDELAGDVATISYEQALRRQTRPNSTHSDPLKFNNQAGGVTGAKAGLAGTPKLPKTASITVRLSQQECAQLRQRAAEAGLTISGYLRSCTLEVESLRTQVKQTLAELRSSPPQGGGSGMEAEGRTRSLFATFRRYLHRTEPRKGPVSEMDPASSSRQFASQSR